MGEVEAYLSTYKFAAAWSPEHRSGAATPPLHASASVPFKWEEQPGKPRPCTDLIIRPEPARLLDPPPCRITKMPSPTTVLDGPDSLGRPRFSSFRLFREKQSSFDSTGSGGSPQSYVDHALFVGKKRKNGLLKTLGRSFRREEVVDEGSLGFSPFSFAGFESVAAEGKMARNGSFSSFSRSAPPPPTRLWATMYEGLKHAMTWKRTRKSKKEGAR
ncbi:uncharacterized protein At4g00950-like [Salvia miltiorrhiza]|uniref:uncharacterized protein At4g00950-like n=1 Tax=Salvia miltiorrhiza TaxID=226208 RepID=UPI0025ABC813|nr:uncharacterized protein At4g00950-like [Salvia miltiorrhiza]